ncbi:MAG: helix-turn-helix domain-containing protein [Anaerolineae bacterium]
MDEARLRTTFGPRLERARKSAGLTQHQLAEMLEVSHRAVQSWEAGKDFPRMGKLPAISEAVREPLVYFFAEGEPEPSLATLMQEFRQLRSEVVELRRAVASEEPGRPGRPGSKAAS